MLKSKGGLKKDALWTLALLQSHFEMRFANSFHGPIF